ncbi:MAG: hypothetical protein KF830_02550 [Planctomycetes bacterium]|nr:hypothetical protein [Planctomycetota bacterium]
MIGRAWRRPLALCCRACLAAAWLPTLAAAGLAVLLQAMLAVPLPGLADAPGARTPWLHLPLLVAAAACAARAAAFWPLVAARRQGADLVARLQRGPLRGCGAAVAGALLAQFVLTLPLATVFARWLGAPARAVVVVELPSPPRPLLAAGQPPLTFALGGRRLREVHLRPLAGPPTGAFEPATVEVRCDGERIGTATLAESRQHVRIAAPPRPVQTLELTHAGGTVPLLFGPGSVTAVEAAERSAAWNGTTAAVVWLLPSFVALAVALLCGAHAALPTALTAAFGLLFVQTVGGAGPADAAVRALLRGHWVGATVPFSAWLPSLAAGSLAMIVAMLLRRRPGR